MKYFLLLLLLTACNKSVNNSRDALKDIGVPAGIGKFKDGDVVCYTYFMDSISCVKIGEDRK